AVTSVNDPPVLVKKIADQTIKEKETFKEIQLDDYVEDADHAKEQLKWTVTGGKGLKFEIDKDRVARVVIPDTYWNGPAETFNITVTDPEGAKAVTTARFAVLSVNDAPAIKEIAAQTVREGGKFADVDLKQFVADPDHAFNKLTVSLSGLKDLRVKNAAGVLQVTAPDAHWHGAETLTITVADPEGAKATAQVAFTVESVNDAPVISGLKGQKIKEKQAFQTVALDKISKDVDHAYKDLSWEFEVKKLPGSSEGDLEVKVDANRVATIAIPDKYWHGAAEITFKVTDPEGAVAKATERFEVESVNDLPVLKKIPDQTIKEKETFQTIALDDFVNDPDHPKDKLKWTVTGGKNLKMEIGKDRVASVKIPDANWNGPAEKFKLTATDPEGGSASTEVTFTVLSVNDPPVLKEIKGQTIKESGSFADIPLKDLVSDLDHKYNQLTWKIEGLKAVKATFTPASGVLKLATPDKYWNGEETLKIEVADPEGGKAAAEVALVVESVNNPPELKKIPDQKIKEGGAFKPIPLPTLVSDPDHKFSELSWDFKVTGAPAPKKGVPSKGELTVETDKDGNAVVKIPDPQWFGKRTIVFTVTDPEGGKATQSAVFEATEVNDPPVIKPIAAQTINEGGAFADVNLDEYVSDADHPNSLLKWSIEGGKELKATIDPKSHKLSVKVPSKLWNSKVPENFTLRVSDPGGLTATAKLSYMVNSINNLPEIKAIKGQTIKEGGEFKPVKLSDYVSDPDHEFGRLKIAVSGNKALKVRISEGSLTVAVPDKYWHGEETLVLTATDPEGGVAKAEIPYVVTSVNNLPEINGLKGQTVKEKNPFAVVKLDALVKDPDHKASELTWDVSLAAKGGAAPAKGKKGAKASAASCDLQATLSDAHELKVVAPDKFWNGACDLTLTVTDPEGGKASATVPFVVESVNDAPAIKSIAAQTIKEGGKFEVIDLAALASDPDHKASELKWSVDGLKALKHSLDAKTGKLTVSVPDKQWHGTENLKLTVVDPMGAKAQTVVALTVQEVNDPPVVSEKLKGQTVKEKTPFAPVKLDEFVSDPDHKANQLVWTVSGGKELKATVSPSRVLTVIAPSKYWHGGPETFTLTVKDPAGASATAKVDYTVTSVNDAPELRAVPGQTVKEGTPFKPVPLATLVTDPDHKKSELKWDVKVSGGEAAPAAKPAKGKKDKKDKKGKAAPAPAPSAKPDLTVTVGADGNATVKVPHAQWNGKRTVVFTVTDPEGASASQSAVFEVLAVNDKPVIKPIAEQTINEGEKFQAIKLADYASDPDHSFGQLKFDVSGLKNLKATVGKDGVLTVATPDKYWNGVETMKLTAMDPDSAKASVSVKFTVRS
ncbi:MAG: tandem-95 repeat protein, partial [Fibrobacterales bacterium]|nr:tandem-95 repeat protein [Fibrobacterales bacterium]